MTAREIGLLRRPFFLPILLVTTVVGWLTFHIAYLPGQTFDVTRFVLYDQGSFLYAIDRMEAGEKLYSEFAWQYGPLVLGWYRAFAALAGNTPLTLVIASGVASGAAWILLVQFAAKRVGVVWAWLGGVFLLLPALTVPCLLSINHGPHGAVEALLLTIVAWLIGGPKNAVRALVLGVLLGCLQLLRFGPHAIAGVVVLLLWLMRDRESFKTAVRSVGLMLSGYGAVVIPYAIWLLVRLPLVAVKEQLWPRYMTAVYAATFSNRWPAMGGFAEWSLYWLPLGVAVAVISFVFAKAVREKRAIEPAVARLLFLPLYFLVGCTTLFRTEYAVLAHLWMVWPAVALVPSFSSRSLRAIIFAGLLPAVFLNAMGWRGAWQLEKRWRPEPLLLPNGQQLWFHGSEATRFGALAKTLQEYPHPLAPGKKRSLAVLLGGGGVHHFFATSRIGRHWWYLPEFVRPWEEEIVMRDFQRHDLFLLVEMDAQKPAERGVLKLWLPFDEKHSLSLLPRIRLIQRIPAIGYVFELSGVEKSP
ncbi:MAG: hypothetical protein ABI273_05865 [Lacunisphaera sp.]